MRIWLRVAEAVATVTFAVSLLVARRADRRDRDAQLAQTLSALAVEKRRVTTATQIVDELPKQIPLPAPIALQSAPPTTRGGSPLENRHPRQESAPGPASDDNLYRDAEPPGKAQVRAQAVIPTEDLKPLYDFTVDCKARQAKLATSQSDLQDERTKTALLAKERDAAIRVARGGSPLRRIARAAKWFLIGAAAGAIATQSPSQTPSTTGQPSACRT